MTCSRNILALLCEGLRFFAKFCRNSSKGIDIQMWAKFFGQSGRFSEHAYTRAKNKLSRYLSTFQMHSLARTYNIFTNRNYELVRFLRYSYVCICIHLFHFWNLGAKELTETEILAEPHLPHFHFTATSMVQMSPSSYPKRQSSLALMHALKIKWYAADFLLPFHKWWCEGVKILLHNSTFFISLSLSLSIFLSLSFCIFVFFFMPFCLSLSLSD